MFRINLLNRLQYFLAFLLSIAIFFLITHSWRYDLTIPFNYSGDALFASMWVKSIIDTGWYLTNSYLGVPGFYSMYSFPMADGFHFVLLKALTYFSKDYGLVYNAFYILSFPTVTISAVFVLKRLGLSFPFALTASLLFAILPYHFEHGQAHIFLSSYFAVPLLIWLAISIPKMKSLPLWSFLLCLVIGSSGIYYAFFGCFYIFVASLISSITTRMLNPLYKAIIITTLIMGTSFANMLPNILSHQPIIARLPQQSEYFGFKITQMLLPNRNHRITSFRKLRNKYEATSVIGSGLSSSIGIMGDVGFLVLIGALLIPRRPSIHDDQETFYSIAKLNLCGVLFATTSGFGALFAYTISPMIRCYDRMSIFIAFFSLYSFFYICQQLWNKYQAKSSPAVLWMVSLLILYVGAYDVTSKHTATNLITREGIFALNAKAKNDKDFIHRIEATVPKESMIFQLPYTIFPEVDYEPIRPYLYSHHLRWSFGSSQTSPEGVWQDKVSQLPVPEMITTLMNSGFRGIYIDRARFPDAAAKLEKDIAKYLRQTPTVSNDHLQSFFSLEKSYRFKSH